MASSSSQDVTGHRLRIDFGILLYMLHLLLLLVFGRLVGLQRQELLVASSANIGGPATASAWAPSPCGAPPGQLVMDVDDGQLACRVDFPMVSHGFIGFF